jgi:5'-nucleotidase / UDP-sugar diphosphatase
MRIKIVSIAIALFFFSLNLSAKPVDFKILFTGGTSGHPLKFKYNGHEDQGGIPARSTLIKKIVGDKNKSDYLLLDTGNIILGSFESNHYDGLSDAAGMNYCKYDAAGIGFSELWYGTNYFFNTFNNSSKFLILCSNVKYASFSKKKESLADNYLVTSFGGANGVKIGIFSVISDTVYPFLPANVQKEISILDPLETTKNVVEQLKSREKVDLVIALTNLGVDPQNADKGCLAFASGINDIDIIIDGGSDLKLDRPIEINNTRIFQAYKFGLFLGEIDLKCDSGKITDFRYELHPVNYSESGDSTSDALPEDSKAMAAIKAKMKNYEKVNDKKLVTIKGGDLNTDNIRNRETEFGDLICDSMKSFTRADIAFQNSGGIAADVFDLKNITRKAFSNAIKYDNTVVIMFMTGKQIRDTLQYSVFRTNYGGFLQVAGLKFTYSKSDNVVKDVMIGNEALDDQKVYKVATNSWLADGGDGHKLFKDIKDKMVLNVLMRDVVYDYLENLKNYTPKTDGRIGYDG